MRLVSAYFPIFHCEALSFLDFLFCPHTSSSSLLLKLIFMSGPASGPSRAGQLSQISPGPGLCPTQPRPAHPQPTSMLGGQHVQHVDAHSLRAGLTQHTSTFLWALPMFHHALQGGYQALGWKLPLEKGFAAEWGLAQHRLSCGQTSCLEGGLLSPGPMAAAQEGIPLTAQWGLTWASSR